MEIKRAEFVTSAVRYSDYAGFTIPEIAVVGKSNVGKSSFINMLTGNKKLARVSKEAGRTRLVNFFSVNGGVFHLVDLPGYGYSAAGRHATAAFAGFTEEYVTRSENLLHVLMLVDIRHPPTSLDKDMAAYLYSAGQPFSIFAVKADKLSRAQRDRSIRVIAAELKVGKADITAVSNTTGEGKAAVEALFDRVLERAAATDPAPPDDV